MSKDRVQGPKEASVEPWIYKITALRLWEYGKNKSGARETEIHNDKVMVRGHTEERKTQEPPFPTGQDTEHKPYGLTVKTAPMT